MAVTLTTTVSGASSNSYISLSDADTYFKGRVHSVVWDEAEDKTAALAQAARMLDDYVDWNGTRATDAQALAWPRAQVQARDKPSGTYLATDAIPTFLKNAQCELAISLIERDRLAEQNDGVSSVMVAGGVSVTFNKADRTDFMPDAVRALIDFYGTVRNRGGGFVRLVRA